MSSKMCPIIHRDSLFLVNSKEFKIYYSLINEKMRIKSEIESKNFY